MAEQTEFREWFQKFHAKYKGIIPPKKWVDRVHESHKIFHEKIGGVSKTVEVEMDDVQNPVPFEDIKDLVNTLYVHIPSYFSINKINRADLCVPLATNGKKFAKDINQWMSKKGKEYQESFDKNVISKTLSLLGEKWAQCKTVKKTLYFHISADPKAFCRIGKFGMDSDSCFSQTGFNALYRLMIGQHPNTFVGLISETPEIDYDSEKFLARVLGFADPKCEIWSVTNIYIRSRQKEGPIHNTIEQGFKKILKKRELEIAKEPLQFTGIYGNGGYVRSFYEKTVKYEKQIFNVRSDHGLNNYSKCYKCYMKIIKDDMIKVDDDNLYIQKYLCEDCYAKQNVKIKKAEEKLVLV